MPNGATEEILQTIEQMNVAADVKEDIYSRNVLQLI